MLASLAMLNLDFHLAKDKFSVLVICNATVQTMEGSSRLALLSFSVD